MLPGWRLLNTTLLAFSVIQMFKERSAQLATLRQKHAGTVSCFGPVTAITARLPSNRQTQLMSIKGTDWCFTFSPLEHHGSFYPLAVFCKAKLIQPHTSWTDMGMVLCCSSHPALRKLGCVPQKVQLFFILKISKCNIPVAGAAIYLVQLKCVTRQHSAAEMPERADLTLQMEGDMLVWYTTQQKHYFSHFSQLK